MNTKCERIKSWHDGEKTRKDPFNFLPGNFLALELYDRITSLSTQQKIHWTKGVGKGARSYFANFPTLDMMEFIFKYYLVEEMSIDDMDDLIDKISLIHALKLKYVKG